MSILRKKPLSIINNIEVFSKLDNYIQNYNTISNKHLKQIKIDQTNPFNNTDFNKIIEKQCDEILNTILINNNSNKKKLKILDAGCGLGNTFKKYTQNFSVYGVDISLDYLNEARNNGLNVILSKIEDLPYKKNTFDFIYISDVLEHVISLYECSTRLIDSLKIGGKIIIRAPYNEDLNVYLDYNEFDYVHLRSINEKNLRLYYERVFGLKAKNFFFLEPLVQENSLITKLFSKELKDVIKNNSEFATLYKYFSINGDNGELYSDLYQLYEKYTDKFNLIKKFFFKPFEFISVFEKKYDLDKKKYKTFSKKNLFSKTSEILQEKNNFISQLEQTISDNQNTITEKNNSISQLEQTISDNQNTITEKNNSISQLEQTISDNQNTITEKNNSISQLEQTISDNQNTITEKNNSISQLEQTISDNQNTITEKNNSISQLEQTISDNQNTITEKNNSISQLEQTISDNQNTITEKNNSISQLEQTISDNQNTITEKNNSISQLEQTISDNQNTITEKNNSISQLEQTISDNQNTITEKNNSISQLEQTISDNQNTITEKNNSISQLEQTILHQNDEVSNLIQKNKDILTNYSNSKFLIKKFFQSLFKKL